jgi:PRTRC genetic system ThiF family protein
MPLAVKRGGNGSAIAADLPYLYQAMLAAGHPCGLDVTIIDGDIVSATNCVRQPFSQAGIGHFKAVVLVSRMNLFWGVNWKAAPQHLTEKFSIERADLVVGCVDSRAARHAIACQITGRESDVSYWLDLGNHATGSQFVLGQPWNWRNRRSASRLRTVAELFPELTDPLLDNGDQPSCSAIEALNRQEPFVHQSLANHALGLLARLVRYGSIEHHGDMGMAGTAKIWQINRSYVRIRSYGSIESCPGCNRVDVGPAVCRRYQCRTDSSASR